MAANSDEPNPDETTEARIQRMIDQGRDLEPGETLDLDDMPENPKTMAELYLEGKLDHSPGAIQHARFWMCIEDAPDPSDDGGNA